MFTWLSITGNFAPFQPQGFTEWQKWAQSWASGPGDGKFVHVTEHLLLWLLGLSHAFWQATQVAEVLVGASGFLAYSFRSALY